MAIIHEPRSRRVFGGDDQPLFVRNGVDLALEIPLPELGPAGGSQRGVPVEVPRSQVEGITANLGLPVEDEVFEDTQFVEENDVENAAI